MMLIERPPEHDSYISQSIILKNDISWQMENQRYNGNQLAEIQPQQKSANDPVSKVNVLQEED